EPQTATAFAEESGRESARNDGGETPSSDPPIAAPEGVVSVTDEKAQAAAQPADPPVTTSTEAAADDHPAVAAETKPVSASTDGGDAPAAQEPQQLPPRATKPKRTSPLSRATKRRRVRLRT